MLFLCPIEIQQGRANTATSTCNIHADVVFDEMQDSELLRYDTLASVVSASVVSYRFALWHLLIWQQVASCKALQEASCNCVSGKRTEVLFFSKEARFFDIEPSNAF